MPFYEYTCPEHGTFDEMMSMSAHDEHVAAQGGVDQHVCPEDGCDVVAPRILSLFGNISTSDDPSFGSQRGEKKNREAQGFDSNTKHGWAERPTHSKSDWEYA